MTHRARWGVGPLRRFTRNLLLPIDLGGHRLLLKYTRNPDEGRAEVRGHTRLRPHYRLPALHATVRIPGGFLLAYERLPTSRDRGLLLDLLNDEEPSADLIRCLDQLTDYYRSVILATAQLTSPHHLVRKLYWDRAAPGGRLDTYYNGATFPVAEGIVNISTTKLGDWGLQINGQPTPFDWSSTLSWLKRHFTADEPVWAAVTQGDPTDVNLAWPLAWLDYDTAGMNSILGEFANFLTYTTHLGGWLVPTYNPTAFADHPNTFTRVPSNRPHLGGAEVQPATRTIAIDYTPALSSPRRVAAATYWRDLVQPVRNKLWPDADLATLLRPYVAMRLLAVYNVATLAPKDRLLVLVRLAEVMAPTFDPATHFYATEPTCPAL